MVVKEDGHERSQAQAHTSPDLWTSVILVATEMAVEQAAVDGHRDGQDIPDAEHLNRFETGVTLAIRPIAAAVADAAHARLPGRWDWHQPRSEREQ
ncbi:MAG TPA: hypothetical protein VNA57_00500 [Acidimicrobiales bacterium]|nr:hypothetical protein [Acidimicrobiales bacterium]